MLTTNAFVVLAILCLIIFASEQIAKTKWGKPLGAAIMVIVLGAVFANVGVIPSASNAIPLYSIIFKYIAPIAIFYLVLGVNLRKIKQAGMPMLVLFVLGSAATVIGVVVSYALVNPESALNEYSAPIAGMIAGTYTGGSINFNAVALHYQVNEAGVLYAGTVAVDNVLTTIWMLVTLAIPKVMHSLWPGKDIVQTSPEEASMEAVNKNHMDYRDFIILIPLGLVAYVVSQTISHHIPAIPSVLTITTIGLILAQFERFHNLIGSRALGLYLVYLFLVVIGAFCEFKAIGDLGDIGITLLMFVGLTVVIHGVITIGVGRLLFTDWKMIAIASQANIGGGTTAMALAETFDREELIVPAILIGTLGSAMGTYLGFMVAGFL